MKKITLSISDKAYTKYLKIQERYEKACRENKTKSYSLTKEQTEKLLQN